MKQADCETVQKQIPLYIDNMLAGEEKDFMQEHIVGCDACRSELALMQSILAQVATLPEPELSADFHERFVENLQKEASRPKIRAIIPWKKVTGFAAAAAVVALSVVSFFQLDQNGAGQNPDIYLTEPTPAVQQGVPDEGKEGGAFVSETEKAQAEPETKHVPKAKTVEQAGTQEAHLPQTAQEIAEEQPAVYTPSSRTVSEDGQGGAGAAASETAAMEPAAHEAFSGDTTHEETAYSVVTVTVAESAKAQAEEILSVHTKDDNGYAVGDRLNEVLSRLEVLEGYSMTAETVEGISENHIVLQ